jgi:hypothetical protein
MISETKKPPFDLSKEVHRTKPDYIVYNPGSLDSNTASNQHFIVFDGPDGSLMAIWTTHTYEGAGDHHIVFSRSDDEGHSWTEPVRIAGSGEQDKSQMANWGFPIVSRSGRIYLFYNKSTGVGDFDLETPYNDGNPKFGWDYVTGLMAVIYSDDNGKNWSKPDFVKMPKSPLDNPDPDMLSNWIVWQKPERISDDDKYYVGFTRWVSPAVRTPKHNNSVHSEESVCEFMRFENIDENPEVKDIEISYHAWGDKALRVPYFNNPSMSCAQEPSIVKLPDGRLFVVMRTMSGYLWYSLSSDQGLSWCNPRPLLYSDHGKPILHPLSCSPIYPLSDGTYILFIHNNDGRVEGQPSPEYGDVCKNRTPVYSVIGRFDAESEQPLVFDEPELFMDNRRPGPTIHSTLPLYGSFTSRNGKDIFWYPDGKLFLLGKLL